MVVDTYNPSTQESEAGGLRVQGQPELRNKTLFQKEKKKRIQAQESCKSLSCVLDVL
jgi:hypothetical protein